MRIAPQGEGPTTDTRPPRIAAACIATACLCLCMGVMAAGASASPRGAVVASAGRAGARSSGVTDIEFAARGSRARESVEDPVVFRTVWGTHYHRGGCFYLRQSCIPLRLSEARADGLEPCSRCAPPR